jgi:hypothetical protein
MCYSAQVRGQPVEAEDEEGCNVGDQTLENLCSGGRVTACQQPNLLLLTLKNGSSAALAMDAAALTARNSSWVRDRESPCATPLLAGDNRESVTTPISGNVASLS